MSLKASPGIQGCQCQCLPILMAAPTPKGAGGLGNGSNNMKCSLGGQCRNGQLPKPPLAAFCALKKIIQRSSARLATGFCQGRKYLLHVCLSNFFVTGRCKSYVSKQRKQMHKSCFLVTVFKRYDADWRKHKCYHQFSALDINNCAVTCLFQSKIACLVYKSKQMVMQETTINYNSQKDSYVQRTEKNLRYRWAYR